MFADDRRRGGAKIRRKPADGLDMSAWGYPCHSWLTRWRCGTEGSTFRLPVSLAGQEHLTAAGVAAKMPRSAGLSPYLPDS
jgi:hypothetical protein